MSQDELPQPYRMISKVIELDILDAAWLDITRAHPEVLLGSDGECLSLKANYALKNACTPSSVIEQPFLTSSLVEAQGFLFMTTNNDALVLADPASGAVLQSLLLKLTAAGAPDVVRASPLWIAAISAPITSDRILRLCLCAVTEEDDVPTAVLAEEAGKKAPAKKGPVVETPLPQKKVGRCKVFIVEVCLGPIESFKSPTLITMTLAFECASISLPSPSKADVKSVDLSLDTEVLCLATPKGCHLFSLPAIEDRAAKAGLSMDNITEDAEGEGENDEVDDAPPVLLEPFLLLDTEFGGKIVKHAALCPLVSATKRVKPPAPQIAVSGPTSRANATSNPFYKTALAVIFETATEWTLLGLLGASSETLLSTAEPKIAVTTAPLSSWFLAAGVSALTFDEGKTLLILGLLDGALSMWNLATRTCTTVAGRHETAVKSLCLSRSESAEKGVCNYFLLTGAQDGTLCFFSINLPRANRVDSFYALSMSDNSAPVCISASFIAFRLDVDPGCGIISIRSLRNLPVAVVQSSDGLSILYDLQGGKLLGKCLLYSGIMSKQIKWHIATRAEIDSAILMSDEIAVAELQPKDANAGPAITQDEVPPAPKALPAANNSGLLFKRASKYAISSSIEGVGQTSEAFDSIATASPVGWHAIYYRDGAPVLASFRLDDMLPVLFPGLASVCGEVGHMVDLFNTLGVEERLDANLASSRIASLGRLHEDDFKAKAKTPGSSSAQRRGSEMNRHRNSKTGLPAQGKLGASIGTISKFSNDDETLAKSTWDRISEPSQVAAKSASKSSADRVSRKMRLLNQLGDLSASF